MQSYNSNIQFSFQDLLQNTHPDSPMRRSLNLSKAAAPFSTSIFLTGESGVGKDLVAQLLHQIYSNNSKQPFVAINCGALPESLLLRELFGCVKGAYTGATNDLAGKFQLADGGTLFLDEVAELSPSAQSTLLRVLQDGRYTPLGATKEKKAHFRLISATHKPLAQLVERGDFRQDLFYRIHVFPIFIPSLRERKMDIPLIAQNIWKSLGQDQQLTPSEIKQLLHYNWPGNIRQLKNILEHYSISKTLGFDLHELLQQQNTVQSSPRRYEDLGIMELLSKNNFNQSQTARDLGISRGSLQYQMRKMELN